MLRNGRRAIRGSMDVLDPPLAQNRSESELGSARGRQRFEGTVGSEKASRSEFIV